MNISTTPSGHAGQLRPLSIGSNITVHVREQKEFCSGVVKKIDNELITVSHDDGTEHVVHANQIWTPVHVENDTETKGQTSVATSPSPDHGLVVSGSTGAIAPTRKTEEQSTVSALDNGHMESPNPLGKRAASSEALQSSKKVRAETTISTSQKTTVNGLDAPAAISKTVADEYRTNLTGTAVTGTVTQSDSEKKGVFKNSEAEKDTKVCSVTSERSQGNSAPPNIPQTSREPTTRGAGQLLPPILPLLIFSARIGLPPSFNTEAPQSNSPKGNLDDQHPEGIKTVHVVKSICLHCLLHPNNKCERH